MTSHTEIAFLVERTIGAYRTKTRLAEEAASNSDRIDATVEEYESAPVEQFIIFAPDSGKFLYGVTPTTGRAVFGFNISNAQVFDRQSVEVGKLHGVSLPAPHFLLGRSS